MRITANGISINYEIKGSGESLVLIHGAGDNLEMWYHQVPVLSRRYRVITPDTRGHGQTESPEARSSVPVFVEDVHELTKAVGIEKAYFLGYSMGGGIAIGLALKYPETVGALILANTPIGSPPSAFFIERQRSNAGGLILLQYFCSMVQTSTKQLVLVGVPICMKLPKMAIWKL